MRSVPGVLRDLCPLLLLLVIADLSGCSLVVAQDQCRTTSDCQSRGQSLSGRVCSPEGYCVPLLSAECPAVISTRSGGGVSDDTILLGHIVAREGPLAALLGKSSERAVELALHEWGQHLGGAPVTPGAPARPLTVILCGEENAEAAARHLVQTVHVPALIGGPISSEKTRAIAERVTEPGGALLVASFSAAPEISRLGELVWRTAQSTDAEATAMALFIGRLGRTLRVKDTSLTRVRMISFHQDDLYGNGLQTALTNRLSDADYERKPYLLSDPKDDAAKLKEVLDNAAKQAPHIITILGTGELISRILVPLEMGWPMGKPRPIYVVPEGMKVPALPGLAYKPELGELNRRLFVFSPRIDAALAASYRQRWLARFPNDPIGGPATYDAMYLLGYSLVALGGKPVTGANLAAGMRRMVPGPNAARIVAGPAAMTVMGQEIGALLKGIDALQAGKNINYQGVSGELDFDVATGDPEGDYNIECASKGDGEKLDFVGTGLYYTALTKRNELLGSYQEPICPCLTCPAAP